MKNIIAILFCTYAMLNAHYALSKNIPPIQLAKKYKVKHPIEQYWISEKLDGIRGYWNGYQLLTKNGNQLNPPTWFTQNWPTQPIDGELWSGRHTFEQVASCVKRKHANNCWRKVQFKIFDLPTSTYTFSQRIKQMRALTQQVNSPHFSMVKQFKLPNNKALTAKLNTVVAQKGEGLMLHFQDAYYEAGRTNNIMKLKPYQDAEATVIKHIEGKGKYKNMLGSIQVKTKDNITFKIGSGFSDKERQNPPPIGAIITFKYLGKTQKGVPKFASFLRIKSIRSTQ